MSANGIATIDDGVMRSDIDAYDIVHDMGIGINLGNTLDAVAGWLNGGGTVEDYETAWGAPVTTQESRFSFYPYPGSMVKPDER